MIRPAREQDAAALADINVQGWIWAYADYVPAERMQEAADGLSDRWRDALREPRPDRETWVATDRTDAVVGFVTVGASRDDDAPQEVGELHAIYLETRAIGTGVGARLLEHGTRRLAARGHTEGTLWVFEANTHARRFYERHGWTEEPGSGPGPWGWARSVRYRQGLT